MPFIVILLLLSSLGRQHAHHSTNNGKREMHSSNIKRGSPSSQGRDRKDDTDDTMCTAPTLNAKGALSVLSKGPTVGIVR